MPTDIFGVTSAPLNTRTTKWTTDGKKTLPNSNKFALRQETPAVPLANVVGNVRLILGYATFRCWANSGNPSGCPDT